MSGPATEQEARERDAIDGRVTFAIAAFVAAGGLIVLLDRVGVSERFIAAIGPTIALLALALIGFLLRTMRISGFYAAGRTTPPVYAGFATAAIATALIAPFTPPVSDLYSGAGVFAGFAFGLAVAAFVSGPYLRKTGAFSISDLVGARFDNMALRLGAALLVGVSALLAAMAGFETAVSALFDHCGPVTRRVGLRRGARADNRDRARRPVGRRLGCRRSGWRRDRRICVAAAARRARRPADPAACARRPGRLAPGDERSSPSGRATAASP